MKQVLIRRGRVVVESLPAPACGDGDVLVRAACSLLSPGTESHALEASAGSVAPSASRLAGQAARAGQALRIVLSRGLAEGTAAIAARMSGAAVPTGYSLAGTVLRTGGRVTDLTPGQAVACAGADFAHHAEIVSVPRQLVVPVPAGLPPEHASFVTLGAVALHGVRQAEARLGEIVVVVGLGLVGQLAALLFARSGCRVVGIDPDAARVERALALGLESGLDPGRDDVLGAVERLTRGQGADAVLVAAASSSPELARQAVRLVRQRGRVVVVGAVPLELDRAELYRKEAELRVSCSYGPGRYDPEYERHGHDYPFAYVRWTENRNMEEFLRLAATAALPLERLIDRTLPVDSAPEAYALLRSATPRPLGVLLTYPGAAPEATTHDRRRDVVPHRPRASTVEVALVGPGHFARAVHLPNLVALAPAARLRAIVARTGPAGAEAARRFGAAYATTDLGEVLADPEVDAVLLCTRHDLHAEQAARALEAGKAVFVEKPAAIDHAGLARVTRAVEASGRPFTVGFNRRFAPTVVALRALLARRTGPLVASYVVHAGRLPRDHWTRGPQGGGRLIGEACHMIDLLVVLAGAPPTDHALLASPPDTLSLTCGYADGSVTTLAYHAEGHADLPKERLECHFDGTSATIEDFRVLATHGHRGAGLALAAADKGHAALLAGFLDHAAGRGPAPIAWSAICDLTRFVLDLDLQARGWDA